VGEGEKNVNWEGHPKRMEKKETVEGKRNLTFIRKPMLKSRRRGGLSATKKKKAKRKCPVRKLQ